MASPKRIPPGIYDVVESKEVAIVDGLGNIILVRAWNLAVIEEWQRNPGLERKGSLPYHMVINHPRTRRL